MVIWFWNGSWISRTIILSPQSKCTAKIRKRSLEMRRKRSRRKEEEKKNNTQWQHDTYMYKIAGKRLFRLLIVDFKPFFLSFSRTKSTLRFVFIWIIIYRWINVKINTWKKGLSYLTLNLLSRNSIAFFSWSIQCWQLLNVFFWSVFFHSP